MKLDFGWEKEVLNLRHFNGFAVSKAYTRILYWIMCSLCKGLISVLNGCTLKASFWNTDLFISHMKRFSCEETMSTSYAPSIVCNTKE